MISTKRLRLRLIIIEVKGLWIDQRLAFQAFLKSCLPPFAIRKVPPPAFLPLIGLLLVQLRGVVRKTAFRGNQTKRG